MIVASCSEVQSQNSLEAKAFAEVIRAANHPQIVDVRTAEEYAGGHLHGAMNVDVHQPDFLSGVAGLDKVKPVYVYCLAGSRSEEAARTLRKSGFGTVINLKGGILAWQKNNLPIDAGTTAPQAKSNRPASKAWTKDELEAAVKSAPQVLVDFYATWCGPCKKMEPHFSELAKEGSIQIIRVDVDANKALAIEYGISEIPVILAYKGGKQVLRMEGYQTPAMLKSAF
jgi:thioredoxin 1